MQRKVFVHTNSWLKATRGGSAMSAFYSQRVFQSTAAAGVQPTSAPNPSTAAAVGSHASSSSSSSDSGAVTVSNLAQLYKSSHKGTGSTPMPKPNPERKLRPRRTPAPGAAATPAAAPPQPLFGARSSCSEDAGPVPQRALSPLQKRQMQFRNKAAFVLTPQALRRVKYLLSQYSKIHPTAAHADGYKGAASSAFDVPCGIRIGVRRRGCSGYSYTVNYYFDRSRVKHGGGSEAPTTPPKRQAGFMEDVVVEQEGVKVVVDADALFYVIGTEMDYVVRNVEEKFTFKNPNQKYGCGCEESFMPFDADDVDED